jgi:hypothetical protein
MSWITASWGAPECYNIQKSAFWRVIRAVVERLNIANLDDEETPWSSHLVWSNLYKIAPAKDGNPGSNLQRDQFNGCLKLLQCELQHYLPRRLLFLTGHDWAYPFLSQVLEDRTLLEGLSFVEAMGHVRCCFHAATCVVASHLQGKNETHWGQ